MTPLVSVIIPTFNYGKYISEAILSVKNQTYPFEKIEIIIIDDGSTANTAEVIKSFAANEDIIYFHQPNRGKASATREGISRAKGQYIFNLDADDYFLPDKIMKTVLVFEQIDEVVHVSSPARCINEINNQVYKEPIPRLILDRV